MRLSAINPFGPVVSKELRVTARRKRTYLLRFVYLGLLTLALLITYVSSGIERRGSVNLIERTQQLNELGRVFFGLFAMFSVITMLVIGPVLTCSSINGERLRNTLSVLLMTPISSWQIISGKVFSRLLVAITLLGLSLPVLAVVRLLGGVELQAMFAVIAISLAAVTFSAVIGIFFSTIFNRAYAVILLAYAVMGFLYLLLPLLIVLAMQDENSTWFLWSTSATNPFFITGSIVFGTTALRGLAPWWVCVVTHLSASALLIAWTGIILRRSARKLAMGTIAPADSQRAFAAVVSMDSQAVPQADGAVAEASQTVSSDALPAKRQASRAVSDHPVLWREIRRPLMTTRWQAVVGSVACVVLLLITYAASSDRLEHCEAQIVYACIFNALITLMVCVLAATVIAQEKEGDTWTVLLASPLTSRAIVWGKALGVLRRMMWPFILIAVHFGLFTALGIIGPWSFVLTLWVMITFNLIFIATGVYLSLRMRTVTAAVVINLLVPLVLYIGVALALLVIDQTRWDGGPPVVTFAVLAVAALAIAFAKGKTMRNRIILLTLLLIIAAAISAVLCVGLANNEGRVDHAEKTFLYLPYNYISAAILYLSNDSSSYSYYRSQVGEVNLSGIGPLGSGWFIALTFAVGLAHVVAAWMILKFVIWRFNRIVGRADQAKRARWAS